MAEEAASVPTPPQPNPLRNATGCSATTYRIRAACHAIAVVAFWQHSAVHLGAEKATMMRWINTAKVARQSRFH
ncbi:hypothetical protein [Rosistilla oblonga]|uniref:hypothetical protein n=1 Tax=Rosistilla oblonga TaxID=2527990 RepID=UPI0018D23B01|nr:hypothetical protein [Rosistilla oblonga]